MGTAAQRHVRGPLAPTTAFFDHEKDLADVTHEAYSEGTSTACHQESRDWITIPKIACFLDQTGLDMDFFEAKTTTPSAVKRQTCRMPFYPAPFLGGVRFQPSRP
jgi:hypothetical protein